MFVSTQTFSDRLWSKITVGPAEECWPWNAGTNGEGYGMIRLSSPSKARVLAHRAAYEERYGPIGSGLVIRHGCDNPPCCNPNHLRVGTKGDNAKDAVDHGRHARAGTWKRQQRRPLVLGAPVRRGRGPATLNATDIKTIRELRYAGETLHAIATRFGVSKSNIPLHRHR